MIVPTVNQDTERLALALKGLGPDTFSDLAMSWRGLKLNEGQARAALAACFYAMAQSFETDRIKLLAVTQHEIRRRVKISARIFGIVRGDLRWSMERSVDYLPVALRAELDGAPLDHKTTTSGWFA
jgi:hypothetical protein